MRSAAIALLLAACDPSAVPCPVSRPEPAVFPAPAGYTVRRCADPQQTVYLIERTGARPATSDEVQQFNQRHAAQLLADGITAIGVGGGACAGEPPRVGLVVLGEAATPGAAGLLAGVERLLAEDGTPELGVPIKLVLGAPRHPRCAASDPACGPIGYSSQLCARPDSFSHPRAPVGPLDVDPRNTCDADGDCMPNGCGNQCTSYRQGNQIGTCEYSTWLEPAWCGCVQRRCRWFK